MENRVKTLEELCELITKEVVEQNKNMIEMNKNLINEVRLMRESFERKADQLDEFKTLLRKQAELFCSYPMPPPHQQQQQQQQMQQPPPLQYVGQPQQQQQQQQHNTSNMYMNDFYSNQSMMNNLSFQSTAAAGATTTMHNTSTGSAYMPNQPPPPVATGNYLNVNQQSNMNNLNASLPSSASALNFQLQQQQQQQRQQQFVPPPQAATVNKQPSIVLQVPPSTSTATLTQQPPLSNIFTSNVAAKTTGGVLNATSTPHASSALFKPPTINPLATTTATTPAAAAANKPPLFQLSPSSTNQTQPPAFTGFGKPSSITAATAFKPSLFGENIFKTAPAASTFTPPSGGGGGGGGGGGDDEEEASAAGGAANPEDYEPQVDFAPIVHLKAVEVKTGEEDEDVLYAQRCKLYRFEANEWKEKGIGELKLLQHRATRTIRVLMRRDQVLKLCANHRLSADMKLTEMSDKQMSWMTPSDASEPAQTPRAELLLAKFRSRDDALKFKDAFDKAVTTVASMPATSATTPAKSTIAEKPKAVVDSSLGQLFKSDGWKCTACYAPNKKESLVCACCSTSRQSSSSSSSSNTSTTMSNSLTAPSLSTIATATTANTTPASLFRFSLPKVDSSPAQSTSTLPTSSSTTQIASKPLFTFGLSQPQTQQAPPPNSISTPSFGTPKLFDLTAKSTTTPATATGEQNKSPAALSFSPFSSSAANANMPTSFGAVASFAKASGFAGGLQPNAQAPKPLFGSGGGVGNLFASPAPAASASAQVDEDGGGEAGSSNDQNPEEYEPQVDFKPLVKLDEVEVRTGEEDEEAVFKQRCKLYRFEKATNEWKEKGTGEIKVLKHIHNENMYRILMRRDQVLKLCANHRVTSELKFEIFNEKQVRWHAQDYSEGEAKHEMLAARFRSEEDANKFKATLEQAQSDATTNATTTTTTTTTTKSASTATSTASCAGLKPSLSEMFKKSNTWTCDGCYVNNKIESSKCVACNAPNKNAPAEAVAAPKAAENAPPKFSFGVPAASSVPGAKLDFGAKPFSFGSATTAVQVQSPAKSAEPAPTTSSSALETAPVFGSKPGLTFADLAKAQEPFGFSGGFQNIVKFQSTATPSMLFGGGAATSSTAPAQPGTTEENDEEGGGGGGANPEEYEPQVDFKPLVKLHEVEVLTGEENEETLFKRRCKLYRFSTETKEWKEKGTGEIKLLRHKLKEHCYRVLMRRDQVLKLCANHRVAGDAKLELVNDKQVRWLAQDCSDTGAPSAEFLTARFRNEEDANAFKNEFERIQQELKHAPTPTSATNTPAKQPQTETAAAKQPVASLASLVQKGTWACDTCLASNKPEATVCPVCETPKPSAQEPTSEDDLQVVCSIAASPEDVSKARSFQLPDNFYLYLNKKACPGCRGCEANNDAAADDDNAQ